FRQLFPAPGWIEHDPQEIWQSQIRVAREALARGRLEADAIAAIGITNQRETTLLWERATGRPVANAIVWQDRRTAELCDALKERGLEPLFRSRTGLVIDPYFSGTKLAWLLEHVSGARARAEAGELAFGTVDSWLVWTLARRELDSRARARYRRDQRFAHAALRYPSRMLGRGAAAGARHPARPAAAGSRLEPSLRRDRARPVRPAAPDRRHRRRPAGRAV